MRAPRMTWRAAVAVLALLLSGCGNTSGNSLSAAAVAEPTGDLYQVPQPLPPGDPGELIWAEKVDLPIEPPATIWRILYHSRSRAGKDIAVSGFAFVSKAESPVNGRPALAWAHGTVGLGDQCAPSKNIGDNFPPYGGWVLERGGVVVATDYEGLGTPGDHPQAVGASAGHNMLDSIRAAAELPDVGDIDSTVLVGHSQGGAAALFASELAGEYSPELTIAAVVALAPGGELTTLVKGLQHSPAIGLALIGAIGMSAEYPELDLSSNLTPKAFADITRIKNECVDATVSRWSGEPPAAVFARDPVSIPAVKRILDENSPGEVDPRVPIFIAQGDNDLQAQVAVSSDLAAKYCRLGAAVIDVKYPGINHEQVVEAAADDVLSLMATWLEGPPDESTCN